MHQDIQCFRIYNTASARKLNLDSFTCWGVLYVKGFAGFQLFIDVAG